MIVILSSQQLIKQPITTPINAHPNSHLYKNSTPSTGIPISKNLFPSHQKHCTDHYTQYTFHIQQCQISFKQIENTNNMIIITYIV